MKIDQIQWSNTCCAWEGRYAEVPTVTGGIARVKEHEGKYFAMFFSKENVCEDVNSVGEPVYREITAAALEKIIKM